MEKTYVAYCGEKVEVWAVGENAMKNHLMIWDGSHNFWVSISDVE